MFQLKKSKGVIFGATGFLGQELSIELSKQGCDLILHGKSVSKLNKLSDQIQKKFNVKPILIQGELNNENFYKNLYKSISLRLNKIDFIFNLIGKFNRLSPLTHFTHLEWSELMEININSHWRILKELEPLLKKSTRPRLIFLKNSEISKGKSFYNILSISKAAIETLAKIYNDENKRLKTKIKIVEVPNFRKGITEITQNSKNVDYDLSSAIDKIIKDSFR
jgi:short-subunit dehydrogenase